MEDDRPGMPGHVFGQKMDFDAIFLENRNFSEHTTNRKVVDNSLYYLNMQFQLNPTLQNQENGQNPLKNGIKLLIKINSHSSGSFAMPL